MPGLLKPSSIARRKPFVRKQIIARTKTLGLKAGLAFASLPVAFAHAVAQDEKAFSFKDRLLESLHSTEILMLAVFGGAMSFALMSASWLIRERSRITTENTELKNSLSNLRAKNDLNDALVNVSDQSIIIWNGANETPKVLGTLASYKGAPEDDEAFLKFEDWLAPEAFESFDPLRRELRTNALPFDTTLKTKNGDILEAQGRISGSYAFVRIREIGSERAEYARIKNDHHELVGQYKTIENLFERLPMPIWLRNASGKLSWINKAYANALELSDAKQAIGTDWNLFDQEQREKITKTQETQDLYQGVLPATVAGDRKKLEVFSIKGKAGFAGIALDKSDVDEISRTLKETNEGHSRMLDQLATAVAIFDKSQKLIFHNNGFQHLWKLDSAFLESQPSNAELLEAMREGKLLPDQPDWRKWRDSQLSIYQAIEPKEEWWHLLDGQTIRVVSNPRNQGGSTWVFENVTERLALESNYNSLMQVQGETLDHLTEAVAVFGSNGKLRLFNPTLEALWNSTDLEIDEGLHIVKIIEAWTETIANPDDLQKILGKVTGLDDERSDLEGRLELRNGSTYEYRLVPLPDGQSMLTLSDITANVNFEKALQERAEALEASDLLKSKFIQHVSYELRAPLTNIAGFGEMLATPEIGSMNEKQVEYLSHINSSADELRAMVDDILDLASIDAGSMTLELAELNLQTLIDDISSSFEPVFAQKSLQMKTEISDKDATIIADHSRMNQVLTNLISNAVNFSPDGGTITISAQTHDDFHEIKVIDQGPGISEDLKDIIFDRFETQAHDGARKGTGLGLSIVRGFIEMHSGSVKVENASPNGACFICRIPLEPEIKLAPYSPDSSITAAA
jgi:signal transduction histidine kinase